MKVAVLSKRKYIETDFKNPGYSKDFNSKFKVQQTAMKLYLGYVVAAVAMGIGAMADSFPFERLNKTDAVLLVLDMQEGLASLVRDFDATLYRQSILAHSALAKVFDLPVILSTSSETGPNGLLPAEITDMYPDAPFVRRQGEVNAWDNADFRAAVQATNKSQVIMAGIVTDVCTTFLALSLRDAGYSVWANIEASGTTTPLIRDVSNSRMARAGVQIVSLFSIACDLMRDWRATPGAPELFPFFDKYYPAYGFIARAHRNAILNGTILSGESVLPS
ncbi:isochorismatase family protein [Grosmannia clavigera kw1407]|uniref:Isochorismatase family protein n=1 Tax=Grosmannia clavigera (strain kw1407 / UAMH 11150) TaxID=655863 RepID=F0XDR7_GROCL|nr:isochorismatase family protein [Grosmannia clavigera kw1407]EFX04683.1 isochorismatase family protein [Grosmannia clavigera kw1407]